MLDFIFALRNSFVHYRRGCKQQQKCWLVAIIGSTEGQTGFHFIGVFSMIDTYEKEKTSR